MIILYINDEHCSSLEQLKGYFTEDLALDSDIYEALIDYSKNGELSEWLREHDEIEIASEIDAIPAKLGDTDYFSSLKAILIGADDIVTPDPKKPTFNECFHIERITSKIESGEANIIVLLKVSKSINEYFTIQIVCGWGTRGFKINSSDMATGDMLPLNIHLRELPGTDIGEVRLIIEGEIIKTIEP